MHVQSHGTESWLKLQLNVSTSKENEIKAYIHVLHSLPRTTINCIIG